MTQHAKLDDGLITLLNRECDGKDIDTVAATLLEWLTQTSGKCTGSSYEESRVTLAIMLLTNGSTPAAIANLLPELQAKVKEIHGKALS